MLLVDMVVYEKSEKGFNWIWEIKSVVVYQLLFFEVYKSVVGLFIVEVVCKLIWEFEENFWLFEFLFCIFQFLDQIVLFIVNLYFYFLLELSFYLGFVFGGVWLEEMLYFDLQEGLFVSSKVISYQYFDIVISQVFY